MTDSAETESVIIRLLNSNDSSTNKAIYCAYAGYLTGVCTRYLSSADDVKDVLHDSFLKIFSSVKSFEYRGKGSLKAWLTRIVVNESLKFIKREYRTDLVTMTDKNIDISIEEPEIDRISMETLHRMIRELPTGYRTVFNLYVFEQKSHKEIAKILSIKEASSASQFHRAKALLAEKIKKYELTNLNAYGR